MAERGIRSKRPWNSTESVVYDRVEHVDTRRPLAGSSRRRKGAPELDGVVGGDFENARSQRALLGRRLLMWGGRAAPLHPTHR